MLYESTIFLIQTPRNSCYLGRVVLNMLPLYHRWSVFFFSARVHFLRFWLLTTPTPSFFFFRGFVFFLPPNDDDFFKNITSTTKKKNRAFLAPFKILLMFRFFFFRGLVFFFRLLSTFAEKKKKLTTCGFYCACKSECYIFIVHFHEFHVPSTKDGNTVKVGGIKVSENKLKFRKVGGNQIVPFENLKCGICRKVSELSVYDIGLWYK